MHVQLQTTVLRKTITAHRAQNEVEEIVERHRLPKVTESTISTREELFSVLDEVADCEHAFDNEERVQGM